MTWPSNLTLKTAGGQVERGEISLFLIQTRTLTPQGGGGGNFRF
jgi:hypothetical protein